MIFVSLHIVHLRGMREGAGGRPSDGSIIPLFPGCSLIRWDFRGLFVVNLRGSFIFVFGRLVGKCVLFKRF